MLSADLGVMMAAGLIAVPLLAKGYLDKRGRARQREVPVVATVIDVQVGQDWRYEEGWYRDPWDGNVKREKMWQTYYAITAQWIDPQTRHVYTYCRKVWADAVSRKPMKGNSITILIDPRHPERPGALLGLPW